MYHRTNFRRIIILVGHNDSYNDHYHEFKFWKKNLKASVKTLDSTSNNFIWHVACLFVDDELPQHHRGSLDNEDNLPIMLCGDGHIDG